MFAGLYGSELLTEDLEMLRFNLRRFGKRWTIGRTHAEDLPSGF